MIFDTTGKVSSPHEYLVWTGSSNYFQGAHPVNYVKKEDGLDVSWMVRDATHILRFQNGKFELYANEDDTMHNNVVNKYPEKAEALIKKYREWIKQVNSKGPVEERGPTAKWTRHWDQFHGNTYDKILTIQRRDNHLDQLKLNEQKLNTQDENQSI